MNRFAFSMAALLLAGPVASAQHSVEFRLDLGTAKAIGAPMPVCVPLSFPKDFGTSNMVVAKAGKFGDIVGQLTEPGILTEHIKPAKSDLVRRDLHLVLTGVSGPTIDVSAVSLSSLIKLPSFQWNDTKGKHADLVFDTRPVMRYMYSAYDNSTPENRDRTYKVFHHLWDPTGKRLVTNGGQTDEGWSDPKKLKFPHHRGLMFAFNKITYDGKKTADTWHAKPKDTHQSHEGFLGSEAGPVLGRHRVAIDWHGPDTEVFAKEEREMTVYHAPGGTMVEFATRLKTAGGKVRLDGDPQHAGFQFRAHNDVADKTAKQTYYLRPDGQGKPGETRNWEPKSQKGPVDLPWNAMSFVLGDNRYTVAYLDHPKNPGQKRYSERDYGRFGCYFEYDLTEDRPLVLNHRIWLQDGEMTMDQVKAHSGAFVSPPKATVK